MGITSKRTQSAQTKNASQIYSSRFLLTVAIKKFIFSAPAGRSQLGSRVSCARWLGDVITHEHSFTFSNLEEGTKMVPRDPCPRGRGDPYGHLCASSLLQAVFFGIALGLKIRTVLTTNNDFIFKGLPRAGVRRFAIIAILRCRLLFAGGSAAEAPVGHAASGSQK